MPRRVQGGYEDVPIYDFEINRSKRNALNAARSSSNYLNNLRKSASPSAYKMSNNSYNPLSWFQKKSPVVAQSSGMAASMAKCADLQEDMKLAKEYVQSVRNEGMAEGCYIGGGKRSKRRRSHQRPKRRSSTRRSRR